jgi:hypothetical protein
MNSESAMLPLSSELGYDGSMTDKPKFTVIDGTATGETPRIKAEKLKKARPDAAYLLSCHRCGSSSVVEVRTGLLMKNGKPTGGRKQLLCAFCMMKGQHVVLA